MSPGRREGEFEPPGDRGDTTHSNINAAAAATNATGPLPGLKYPKLFFIQAKGRVNLF